MRYIVAALLALALVGLGVWAAVGCSTSTQGPPVTPGDQPGIGEREILDGSTGGIAGFYFLPPVRPRPNYTGVFDASLLATLKVEIVKWANDEQVGPPIVTYTSTTGSGSEMLRVSTSDQQYIVNWHTNRFDLEEGGVYRISVRLKEDNGEYGYADVQVFANGKEAKDMATDDTFALVDGRTLPVKFRIETGARAWVPAQPGHGYAAVLVAEPLAEAAPGAVVASSFAEGIRAGSEWYVELRNDGPQLVTLCGSEDDLIGLAVVTTAGRVASLGEAQDPCVLDQWSTATALLYLVPGMLPTDQAVVIDQFAQGIRGLPSVVDFVAELGEQLQQLGHIDLQAPGLRAAFETAADSASQLIWGAAEAEGATITPSYEAGLSFTGVATPSDAAATFQITNCLAVPWVVYSDTSANPIGYVWFAETPNPAHLGDLLTVAFAWRGLEDAVVGPYTTPALNCPLSPADYGARLTTYSAVPVISLVGVPTLPPSALEELLELQARGEVARVVMPTLIQLVFQQLLPVVTVGTGFDVATGFDRAMELAIGLWEDHGSAIMELVTKAMLGTLTESDALAVVVGVLQDTSLAVAEYALAGHPWMVGLSRVFGQVSQSVAIFNMARALGDRWGRVPTYVDLRLDGYGDADVTISSALSDATAAGPGPTERRGRR